MSPNPDLATLINHFLTGTLTESGFDAALASLTPPGAVDRAAGIVRGVCVLGSRSEKNRVKFPPAVLARHAAMYAAPVNVRHHVHPVTGEPIAVPDGAEFGRLVNPRASGEAIYADLHILDAAHPFADEFLSACEANPARFALSPLHHVRYRPEPDADGFREALVVTEVRSVDIVEVGATTASMFLPRIGGA